MLEIKFINPLIYFLKGMHNIFDSHDRVIEVR